jgi:hypothetical protein
LRADVDQRVRGCHDHSELKPRHILAHHTARVLMLAAKSSKAVQSSRGKQHLCYSKGTGLHQSALPTGMRPRTMQMRRHRRQPLEIAAPWSQASPSKRSARPCMKRRQAACNAT